MANSNPIPDNGINIIPCNRIHSESVRLRGVFRNCMVLDEKDMRDIISLIYSVSLCNSGEGPGIQQDNILIFINTPPATISSIGELDMASIVNTMPQFVVDDTQLVIFKTSVNIVNGDGRVDIMSVYHRMANTGRGLYGVGGTVLNDANFFFLKSNTIASIGGVGNNTILYDIETSDINIYNNSPHQALNASNANFPIIQENDYYFRLTYIGLTDTVERESLYKVYRFKGAVGNYGILGGSTSIADDFIPYGNDSGNLGSHSREGLSIRTLAVLNIISSSQKIHEIINSGPWNTIQVSSDELISFVIRRKVTLGNNVTLYTEKYYWKKGRGTITRNSVEADFDLYEKSTTLDVVGTTGPAVVLSGVGDILQPQEVLNSLEQSIIKTLNNQILLAVHDVVGKMNVYEFVGDPGTYGNGNKDSSLSDFVLKADESTAIESIIEIEPGTDITVDNSNPRKPKISYVGAAAGAGLITTTLEIGEWSIVESPKKSIAHGIDISNWRSIRVISVQVSTNDGILHYEAMRNMDVSISQDVITMSMIDGTFTTPEFSGDVIGNRGWVTIVHD